MNKYAIVLIHRKQARKLYTQRTLDAIARRIRAGETEFKIGRRSYWVTASGVHFEQLGEPFCIMRHELPLPETYWTRFDHEALDLAEKNLEGKDEAKND